MRPARRAGGSEINEAKIVLANEVTTLLPRARPPRPPRPPRARSSRRAAWARTCRRWTLSAAEVGDGISVAQLITRSGLAKSGKEAKRLIADGGARLNDAAITDAGQMLGRADMAEPIKLSAGKNATRSSCWSPDPLHLSPNTAGGAPQARGRSPLETGTPRLSARAAPAAARCPIHMKIAIITAVAPASISVVRTRPVPAIPSRTPVTVAASRSGPATLRSR
jgi:ribosome-associated protein YbcJ (S4-like RNA binding protein)